MEAEFRRQFDKINRFMMLKADYDKTVDMVSRCKGMLAAGRPAPEHMMGLLRRYNVATVDGERRLVVPAAVDGDHGRFTVFAYVEELFRVIGQCHVSNGHSGRKALYRLLRLQYRNVTVDAVNMYVGMCAECKARNSSKARTVGGRAGHCFTPQAAVTAAMATRGQVDVVSMDSQPDGPFRHYMVYRDQATGFVYLQALATDHTDDVTYTLFDLFATFGAPAVLQSDTNGREFAAQMVQRVRAMWPDLRLVHGHASQQAADDTRRLNDGIRDMLDAWLRDTKTANWCVGLKVVQSAYNHTVRPGMRCSPAELMFGKVTRTGLTVPQLPAVVAMSLKSEEDVHAALKQCIHKNDGKSGYTSSVAVVVKAVAEIFTKGKVGDHVNVKLTGVGQGLYGIRETPGVILSIKGDLYEIGTDLGRLSTLCNRHQFQVCDQDKRPTDISEFPLDNVCSYEVTEYYSIGMLACGCLMKCKSKKCICRRMNTPCKPVCHGQSSCYNSK